MPASPHTRLMNMFIGLCLNAKEWPSVLHELGYRVQLVEQSISLHGGAKIRPDAIAVSNRLLHAMVADCKSGNNIDSRQDEKYRALEPADLANWVTAHGEEDRLRHAVCYVDGSNNHKSLKDQTRFPFITFGKKYVQGSGGFGHDKVDRALCAKIPLDGMMEPAGYYPFSPEDEEHVLIRHVLRGVVSYLSNKEGDRPPICDADAALRIIKFTHPSDKMPPDHTRQLAKRIRELIVSLLAKYPDFKDKTAKLEGDGPESASMKGLERICARIVSEYEKTPRLTRYMDDPVRQSGAYDDST